MKRPLVVLQAIVFSVIVLAPPILLLLRNYSPQAGWLALAQFGRRYQATCLHAVQATGIPAPQTNGYDGQFYAQLALDPFVTNPLTERALDNPVYRARRLGLPLLAFILGLGKPAWILQAYCLLNFIFWIVLFAALGATVGYRRCRDWLLAAAVLCSTGTLISLSCSLTDLSACTVSTLAVLTGERWLLAGGLLGVAALIKETSVLSFVAAPWPNPKEPKALRRVILSCLVMALPLAGYLVYVHLHLSTGQAAGAHNFALPFWGMFAKLRTSVGEVAADVWCPLRKKVFIYFELFCPLSLYFQASYLFARPRLQSRAWRLGIGFAVLMCLLGSSVWNDQIAYARTLLPLTVSFNFSFTSSSRAAGTPRGSWQATWV